MFGDKDQTSAEEKALQQGKYDELIGILLSAGYFRARIATLSPFDKVVGGLCWCITSSGTAVDADILFDEDLSLGQKIRLSEKITKTLRAMGCPAPLQANQIQGSDFAAIFPVIQWLVRKVLETRLATGDVTRLYSESHYVDAVRQSSDVRDTSFIDKVSTMYSPRRKFRRNPASWQATLTREARVLSCLLEYGEKISGKANFVSGLGKGGDKPGEKGADKRRGGTSDFERKLAAMKRVAEEEEVAKAEAAEELEKQMLNQMSAEGKEGAVSGSNVGKIMGLQGSSIKASAAEYKRREDEIRAAAASGSLLSGTVAGKAMSRRRQLRHLNKQLAGLKTRIELANEERSVLVDEIKVMEESLKSATAYNQRVRDETAKLEATAKSADKSNELGKLRELITLNESLKAQEAAFKGTCKEQLESLQGRLAELKSGASIGDESARMKEIEEMYAERKAKYIRARQLVARKNRQLAVLTRKIDEIPTRPELIQYERRFVELFNQIAAKLDETKKYYATYNALFKKQEVLSREESLIESINDQFAEAMRSKSTRESFIESFRGIIRGIEGNLSREQEAVVGKRAERDAVHARFQKLLAKQRSYFKAVKDFQEACDFNERLAARAQQLEQRARRASTIATAPAPAVPPKAP